VASTPRSERLTEAVVDFATRYKAREIRQVDPVLPPEMAYRGGLLIPVMS
jgi:hypothetical protein